MKIGSVITALDPALTSSIGSSYSVIPRGTDSKDAFLHCQTKPLKGAEAFQRLTGFADLERTARLQTLPSNRVRDPVPSRIDVSKIATPDGERGHHVVKIDRCHVLALKSKARRTHRDWLWNRL